MTVTVAHKNIRLVVFKTEVGFQIYAHTKDEEIEIGHLRFSETDGTLQLFKDDAIEKPKKEGI
jgi:hypothetical protein